MEAGESRKAEPRGAQPSGGGRGRGEQEDADVSLLCHHRSLSNLGQVARLFRPRVSGLFNAGRGPNLSDARGSRGSTRAERAPRAPGNFARSAGPGPRSAGPGAPSAGARRRRSSFPLHVTGAARRSPTPGGGTAAAWQGAPPRCRGRREPPAGAEGPGVGAQPRPPPGRPQQPRGPRFGAARSLS